MLLVRDELSRTATPGDHAISIGVFDGVHGGHRMLIGRMIDEARARGLTGGVVTFHPPPGTVVHPDEPFSYIESLERRVELLRELGAAFVSVLTFTSELQQVSAADFTRLLVEEARMRLLVVGEDFRLGRGGEGTVERLRAIGQERRASARRSPPGTWTTSRRFSADRTRSAGPCCTARSAGGRSASAR